MNNKYFKSVMFVLFSSLFVVGMMIPSGILIHAEETTYKVTYNANTGVGTVPVDNNKYKTGDKVIVLDNTPPEEATSSNRTETVKSAAKATFKRESQQKTVRLLAQDQAAPLSKDGFIFNGWNTQADGKGTAYQPKAELIIDKADVKLFAQWKDTKPNAETYTLVYDVNGGKGTLVDEKKYKTGEEALVAESADIVRDGYTFDGWNTKADGSGTTYRLGGKITFDKNDIKLFAQWKADEVIETTYQVTYDTNGGTGTLVDEAIYHEGDVALVLVSANIKRDGYTFDGWNTKADGTGETYRAGDHLTIATNDVTLFAMWKQVNPPVVETFTVTYDANGGKDAPVDAKKYKVNDEAIISGVAKMMRKDFVFESWNTKQDGTGTKLLPESKMKVTGNTTLFAMWKKVEAPVIDFINNAGKKIDVVHFDIGAVKEVNYLDGVSLKDSLNPDITTKNIRVDGKVNPKKLGIYRVTYNYPKDAKPEVMKAEEKIRIYIVGGQKPQANAKYAIIAQDFTVTQQQTALSNKQIFDGSSAQAVNLMTGEMVTVEVKTTIDPKVIGTHKMTFQVKDDKSYQATVSVTVKAKKLTSTGESTWERAVVAGLVLVGGGIVSYIVIRRRRY